VRFLLVGIGGGAGSVLRYAIGLALAGATFPYATLIVNVVGCFFIGLAMASVERTPLLAPDLRLLLVVGFLGGFTTFSAFGYESVALFKTNATLAALNVAANIFLGLAAVLAGRSIAG